MIRWFPDRPSLEAATAELAGPRAQIESYLAVQTAVTGYCCACDRVVEFKVGPTPADGWIDLRESFLCSGCGLSGRGRTVLTLLRSQLAEAQPRTLMLEQLTAVFVRVSAEFPFVQGCEYLGDDIPAGEVRKFRGHRVRHENLMALSCADGSLDVVFHGDVLEHVPDHRLALRECARVLTAGGTMLFSAPFFRLEEHLVRAEVIDGKLVHHLEPGYHGNPVSKKGSLVFTHHGWPLLDDIRAAGFSTVEVGLLYEPFQGIVSNNNPYDFGHMWPVVFRARK